MADVWPPADQNPDLSASLVEFAGIWRYRPKLVFSRNLTQAGWKNYGGSRRRAFDSQPTPGTEWRKPPILLLAHAVRGWG
jgi:hypothetical protein